MLSSAVFPDRRRVLSRGAIIGGIGGAITAHTHVRSARYFLVAPSRSGSAQGLSEFIATFGLLCVIWGCSRYRSEIVPFAVGAYITAAYWFTSSTSFANPAVTIARSLSDTFAGIRPADVPLFVWRSSPEQSPQHSYFAGSFPLSQ